MNAKQRAVPVWLAAGCALLIFGVAFWIGEETWRADNWYFFFILSAFGGVGALIASHQPRNLIGWLFLVITLMFAIEALTASYINRAYNLPDPTLPGVPYAAWLNSWIGNLAFGLLFTLLLLLFPDGRLPSPRWRIVLAFVIGGLTLSTLAAMLGPVLEINGVDTAIANPFALGVPIFWLEVVEAPFATIAICLCALALVVRFIHSRGVERKQIKWLAYVAVVAFLFFAASLALETVWEVAPNAIDFLLLGIFLAIPAAVGIAILRYRLFDIDIIIRRTLTYTLVTGTLLVIFFGSVVVLQQLVARISGTQQNELVTVLSTLLIAALFVPLRNRIQSAIDRRFNRKKYDAQKVLMDFATTVRDETDLEKLTARLMQVVNETMQPTSLSVWLKSDRRPQTTERRQRMADSR